MDSYTVVVEDDPNPVDLAFLEERMAEAAVAAVGVGDEEEFAVVVREDGRIVAGISAVVWGGSCQVHVVWVDEVLRGRGIGQALLRTTESEAAARGCRLIMGLTYAALTGDYYDRVGYRTVGVIENCPAGTTTRWYCRDLSEE